MPNAEGRMEETVTHHVMLRVWIGSGDGPDYARRALAAQEGTR